MPPLLGLTAYRALARREEAQTAAFEIPRPDGELVWLHAAETGNLIAVSDLAQRLMAAREGLSALITTRVKAESWPSPPAEGGQAAPIYMAPPNEHPLSVASFLDHWRPDTAIWTWGALHPNLILETADRGCPLFLVDADSRGFDGPRDRWMLATTRRVLSCFDLVLTRTEPTQRRMLKLGRRGSDVEVASPLLAGGHALLCNDNDLADLAKALGGRSVWFATNVQPGEIDIVLSAHLQALRLSHRLLLILHPSAPAEVEPALEHARARGFTAVLWGSDTYPDSTTQILIAEDAADRGLFFRVAPVSFLGSSLVPDRIGSDPFEAAALGSAVLYGPKVRQFLPSYTRLAAAGAARIVNDAAALGTAVSRLIAPDQAATMAHAGWDVISEGAALTDRVTDLVQDALDAAQAGK